MAVQGQRLATRQTLAQKQVMTQKLIQSIKLMAMPLAELRETIAQEVEKNPALEVVREAGEVDLPNHKEERGSDTDLFANSSDPGYQPAPAGDPDSKQRFLEGAISRDESLRDSLIDQLRISEVDGTLAELAERIIWNLNDDGFHREDPVSLLAGIDPGFLDQALDLVRSFDPQGCACRDWRESLLVQSRIRGDAPDAFEVFVNQGLAMLENKKSSDVRTALSLSQEDWDDLDDYVRLLVPFPGRLHASSSPQYIIPDLEVRRVEGEHVLILNDEVLPVLQIDPEFEVMKDEYGETRDAKRFVNDHSREARYFINSLRQRENTLLKTARAIVEFQGDFFRGGPRYLKPLTLKDIAGEIGVHEATVSRITTNKYVQTEWGLFELKYFFTNSISGAGSSGSRVSKVAAKEVIREILENAEPGKKISDQKISDLLAKRGINLARRTVAKYRGELDLPSSYRR